MTYDQMLSELRKSSSEVRYHVLRYGQSATTNSQIAWLNLINGAVYCSGPDVDTARELPGVSCKSVVVITSDEREVLLSKLDQLNVDAGNEPLDYSNLKMKQVLRGAVNEEPPVPLDSLSDQTAVFIADECLIACDGDDLPALAHAKDAVSVLLTDDLTIEADVKFTFDKDIDHPDAGTHGLVMRNTECVAAI